LPQLSPALNALLDSCLKGLGISLFSEWDVLTFLYRRGTSLASAEHISRLLGYGKGTVGSALDRLEFLGLVQRSRASREVCLYQFATPRDPFKRDSFDQVMNLGEQRIVRLLISKKLARYPGRRQTRERTGLHLA